MKRAYAAQDPLKVFQDMLGRWSSYVLRLNLSALGYAQSRYTDMVGGSTRADPIDDIDPAVLSWDEFYKNHLPPFLKQTIYLHWLAPGRVKTKHAKNGNQEYYARKRAAEEAAMSMWNYHREQTIAKTGGAKRAHSRT